MTGFSTVKVYDVSSVPDSFTRLEIDGEPYLSIPTLYDNGSDGAAVAQTLDDGVLLYTLENRVISVQTVSGVQKKILLGGK